MAHIVLSRCKKIKSGLVNLDYYSHSMDILLFVTGIILSILMSFITIAVFFYYGMRAKIIFTLLKFTSVTLTLLVSYVVILRIVKNSKNRFKNFQYNTHSLHQQEKMLGKVRKTVSLVVGGYILTLLPFTCSYTIEMYIFYNKDFEKDNEVFAHVFRSVSEMNLYMNSIFNIIIYFHTNTELRKEVAQLGIVKRANIKLNSLKSLLRGRYNT